MSSRPALSRCSVHHWWQAASPGSSGKNTGVKTHSLRTKTHSNTQSRQTCKMKYSVQRILLPTFGCKLERKLQLFKPTFFFKDILLNYYSFIITIEDVTVCNNLRQQRIKILILQSILSTKRMLEWVGIFY